MNWIWILIRVTGLTAYLLLTLSLLAGIYRHLPIKKKSILDFHQAIGQIGLLSIGIHMYLLFYDNYQQFSVVEVLIPFMSSYEPILTGIGTIAMYLVLIVIITSDFMKAIGRSVWKKTHYLVFPMWFLAFLHSFFIGTDSSKYWALSLYGVSFIIVVGSTIYMIWKMNRKKQLKSKKSPQPQTVIVEEN